MKKKITTIITTLFIASALIGCTGTKEKETVKNVPTADIVKSVQEQIELRGTAAVEGDLLKEQFYLNMDDVEEQTIEKGQINTGLETLAVVKAKSGKTESVKEAFEKVKEDKKISAFYPGELEAVEAAEIKIIGDYVGFFIIPDYEEGQNNSQKAIEIFEEALK